MLGRGQKQMWVMANHGGCKQLVLLLCKYKHKTLTSLFCCQHDVTQVGIMLIQEHTIMGSEPVLCDLGHWQR